MKHIFDVDIAEKYGIYAAVILENLWYWIKENEANERNFHDGEYWTFNSKKAYQELFPYLSERKIESAFKTLVDAGLIKTGCYNDKPFDRTLWYALTDAGRALLQNGVIDFYKTSSSISTKCPNPLGQNVPMEEDKTSQPIPNINTYINPYINTDINNPLTPFEGKYNLELVEALNDWMQYKKEKRQGYKPMGLKSFCTQVDNYVAEYGEAAVAGVIRDSMSSGYTGVVWDRLKRNFPKTKAEKAREELDAAFDVTDEWLRSKND